jgi:hypothetical protein
MGTEKKVAQSASRGSVGLAGDGFEHGARKNALRSSIPASLMSQVLIGRSPPAMS